MEEQQVAKMRKQTNTQKSSKNLFIGGGVIALVAIAIALYYNHTRKYPSTIFYTQARDDVSPCEKIPKSC